MNQILDTKQPNNNNNNNNGKYNSNSKLKKFKGILKFQLYFSIVLIIIIGLYVFYNTYKLSKQEKYSKQILENYNLTRLYSNVVSNNSYSDDNQSTDSFVDSSYVIGVIDIPKINVNYPIFSNYDENLLKISPCRFYGPLPGKNGNLCIAGHNYDNDKFFSKIVLLNTNDQIILKNNYEKNFYYFVSEIYEVKNYDFSPIYDFDRNKKQLTLITCNNINKNRIILKAFAK